VTFRAAVADQDGRTVELTEERWGHITERHPEIRAFEAEVLLAVERPDRLMRGRQPGELWSYLKTDVPSSWLKVVVAYADGRGHIVTAYPRRSMP
jgi:hypothetical protein